MRILLDECVDHRLARELSGHDVLTVHKMEWAGISNGKLLALAVEAFDIFLTVDRNLSFQQPVTNFDIAVIVMCASTNRLQDLKTLIPELLELLPQAKPGEVSWVGE